MLQEIGHGNSTTSGITRQNSAFVLLHLYTYLKDGEVCNDGL